MAVGWTVKTVRKVTDKTWYLSKSGPVYNEVIR
jgi:hypothetical protein